MKSISLTVSKDDYEAFRRAAKRQNRPIGQLIREAMAEYRKARLPERTPLTELPVLPGHRATGALPSRAEIYDEIFNGKAADST
jgi:Ribbon-helix-helix protein, copG family